MTGIDTAALRALADASRRVATDLGIPADDWCYADDLIDVGFTPEGAAYVAAADPTTVRALCDGYDEAARLRARTFADYAAERYQAERDAARQALADLVADLRALCEGGTQAVYPATVDAVIDRHAPEGDR